MVVITNGLQTVVVSNGAYREIYMSQGWYPVQEATVQDTAEAVAPEEVIELEPEELETEDPVESGEDSEEPKESTEEVEVEDSDLLLRPLSDLTLKELRRVAALREISIEGLKVKSDIRQVIKTALKQ